MADPELLDRGRRAFQVGDFHGASSLLKAHLLDHSNDVECWFLYGAACHRLHQLAEARDAFQQAADLAPRHLESRLALASVFLALDMPTSALAACTEAALLAPDLPKVRFSLAVAEEACGFLERALDSYNQILVQTPSHVDSLKNRGALLMTMGRIDDAVANNRLLASKQPYSYVAQFNLGDALIAQQSYKAAAEVLMRAVSLSPKHPKALLHAAFALAQMERFPEAQQLLDRAQALDPGMLKTYRDSIFHDDSQEHLDARVLFLLRHYDAIERCDWRAREYFMVRFATLIQEASVPPLSEKALGFRAMAMGLAPEVQLQLARQIASKISRTLPEEKWGAHAMLPPPPASTPRERIRLAYISPDLRNHPTGLLSKDLFALHERSRFEVTVYSLCGEDGSDVCRAVIAGCDRFVDLSGMGDADAAARIARDQIDILIDLGGYNDRSRPAVLAHRPAKLQISWLAYIATMGAEWIDYLVGDVCALPVGCDTEFSETLIRLPNALYLCSYAGHPLSIPPERVSLGLPENAIVLGAMHNPYKIDPEIFGVWMRVLHAVPMAILWLIESGKETEANLRRAVRDYGIDDKRLIFAPKVTHAAHLARLQQVDLILDTSQCNGGTTTADALVAGVPVVSCRGRTLTQRMAGSLLFAAGQEKLIVSDLAEYESLVLKLLTDQGELLLARQNVVNAKSSAPFFNPALWVRYFEQGLEHAWKRHLSGLPPASIEIKA